MKNSELKSLIYQKLDELDDEGLQMVNDRITEYLEKATDDEAWNALSDEDRAAIEEGIEQVEKGMTVSYDEVRRRIHKKLSQHGLQD